MKKILIIGASSFIGSNLAIRLRERHCVYGTYASHRPALDGVPLFRLALPPGAPLQALVRHLHPDAVMYCAGGASDKALRADPLGALFVHAEAPLLCAETMSEWGGRLFYLSTSKVFSGEKGEYTEEDEVCPQTVYGSAKRRGEEMLAEWDNAIVLRLGNVFGWAGSERNSFLDRLLGQLWRREEVPLICDEYRCFLGADELSRCLEALLERETAGGLYHLSDSSKQSFFTFARKVVTVFDLPAALLRPVTGHEFSRITRSLESRGDDLSLRGEHFAQSFSLAPRPAEDSLVALRDRLHAGKQ